VISAKKYISCQYLSAGIIKDIIGIPRTRVFNEIVWSPDDIFSVLCIPGNISSDLKELQSIFQVLVSKFDAVCYIPGEIILENSTSKVTKQNESKISEDTEMTLEYYKKVLLLAKSCRLYIGPLRVQTKGGAVIIFPLYSWRQENVFFTNEDEIDTTEIRLFSAIVHDWIPIDSRRRFRDILFLLRSDARIDVREALLQIYSTVSGKRILLFRRTNSKASSMSAYLWTR